jgi:hypothetical protein
MNYFLPDHRQPIRAKLFSLKNFIDNRLNRPFNVQKWLSWYQHHAAYFFVLGCALLLVALLPTTKAPTKTSPPVSLAKTNQ